MRKIRKIESLYEKYDALIVKCVPDYHKILQIIANSINGDDGKMLDIGIGTGNLEKYIFEKFPRTQITGIDTSTDFLNTAKIKFGIHQLQVIHGNILNYKLENDKFSRIFSSLTIHHFKDSEKIKLFRNIYQALNKNGSFINFDMVKPETEAKLFKLKEELLKWWKAEGLSNNFIEEEKREMAERDHLVEQSKQKRWLKEIGFSFRIIYKKGLFCVYLCKKK